MKCADWEVAIALHAEGDLPERRIEPLERHLAGCAACREFAEELRESQAVLKSLREEPLDDALCASVRARVMDRIARPRETAWAWWWWRLAVAGGAASLLVMLLDWKRPVAPVAPAAPAVVARLPEEPRWEPAPPPVRRAAAAKPRRQPVPPPEPLVVKLVTDDPDVVIYWVVDRKGESL